MISIKYDSNIIKSYKESLNKIFKGKEFVVVQINRQYYGG